jgi:hypothetical protein
VGDDPETPAHDQKVTRSYYIHYPAHDPRETDPHYGAFEAFRRATKDTAKCHMAEATGDSSHCQGGLELHHARIEFALQNGVDFELLAKDFPSLKDPSQINAWIESPENLRWYCEFHHRGHGGVHVAAAADFEASFYVKGLLT